MNQPHPDEILMEFAKQLEQQTAEVEYITLLLNKAQGLPVWFH